MVIIRTSGTGIYSNSENIAISFHSFAHHFDAITHRRQTFGDGFCMATSSKMKCGTILHFSRWCCGVSNLFLSTHTGPSLCAIVRLFWLSVANSSNTSHTQHTQHMHALGFYHKGFKNKFVRRVSFESKHQQYVCATICFS